MLRTLAVRLGALALALGACTSSNAGAPDATGPDTCSSDAECPANFKCDREQRRCVCTGDAACPGGFCNAFTGACVASVPGCHDDSACGANEYCDRALRSCRPKTITCAPCKSDDECGAGSRCAAHPTYPQTGTFCVKTCSAGGADGGGSCSDGMKCLARDATAGAEKLCYPPDGPCGDSNVCTPDSRKLCQTDADCGDPAQVCDGTLKWCVAKVRTCPAGDACDPQQSICVHACSVDADCLQIEGAPGYKCTANACVRLAICSTDTDCTDGQVCQANPDGSKSCAAGCVQNTDCPLGESCNKTDPKHPKCVQGCASNPDCPLNAICVGGVCKSSLSGSDGSCAQTCQTVLACPIASACAPASQCCSAANLGQVCPATQSPTPQPSAICPACSATDAAGCAANCSTNCFPISLRSCGSQIDCGAYPGTVCTKAGLCQTMIHVLPCTSDIDCPYKGFKCRAQSQFCGNSFTGSVCMPDLAAAQVACLLGHL